MVGQVLEDVHRQVSEVPLHRLIHDESVIGMIRVLTDPKLRRHAKPQQAPSPQQAGEPAVSIDKRVYLYNMAEVRKFG